jgi:ribonuclease HI
MSSQNYYVIFKGKKTGIFPTWEQCKLHISGYPNSIYKKFNNLTHAEYFLQNGTMPPLNQSYINTHEHISIFTDGSTIRKDNTIKYGYGVYIPELKIEISQPFIDDNPTNNRCELTAILVGINTIIKEYPNLKNIHIYTDSKYSILMLSKKQYEIETLNIDLLQKIQKLIIENNININYYKVQAHSGYTDNISIANDIVDKLAYQGAILYNQSENIEDYKLTFGKYNGFAIKNIPNDYLKWVIKQKREGKTISRNMLNDINHIIEYFKNSSKFS